MRTDSTKLHSVFMIFGLLIMALNLAVPRPTCADPAAMMGSGCIWDADKAAVIVQKCQALNAEGVKSARLSINSGSYWWWGKAPQPNLWTAGAVKIMKSYGITPMFLFEYQAKDAAPYGTMLTYDQWKTVGQAYAQEFAPNSTWWTAQGVRNFGCTTYEAINEPDGATISIPFQQYHDALKGLADGIHSVNPKLKVFPAGFATPNSASNFTMKGYGTAIADLWNNGTLDGMDLHTYSNWYASLSSHNFSSQYAFDKIKNACGITQDINFYCTEFNYMGQIAEGGAAPAPIGDAASADYLLTCTWDQLDVVGNKGQSVSQAAFIYTLYDTASQDKSYGLCTTFSPFVPTQTGAVYRLVAQLTSGMNIVYSDPKGSGVVVLTGSGKKMWVWQDRPNWTNIPGASLRITGIPSSAVSLKVYGYDGLRSTIKLAGQSSYLATNLPGNETYMFVTTLRGR